MRPPPSTLAILSIWLVTSLAATVVAAGDPWAALPVAVAGGTWFGWLSARRVDPLRVRVGRRRRRPEPGPE